MSWLSNLISGAAVIVGVSGHPVTEWEHGWKTDRVTATRYKSDAMGYNIGFQYPKNIYDADRVELSDFMEANKGWVFQGGGYPGAVMYVKFKDVTDRKSADKKLQAILPPLSQLIEDIGNGKKVVVAKPKPEYEWPDAAPPDKSDPYWELNNNMNINGTQYKKAEISPGRWQWVIDKDVMKALMDAEDHRQSLWMALQTRVLTDQEMLEALRYGDSLNITPMESYYADDKKRELDRAVRQQDILRAVAAKSETKATP